MYNKPNFSPMRKVEVRMHTIGTSTVALFFDDGQKVRSFDVSKTKRQVNVFSLKNMFLPNISDRKLYKVNELFLNSHIKHLFFITCFVNLVFDLKN